MSSVASVSSARAVPNFPRENKGIGGTIREWLSAGSEWVSQSIGSKLLKRVTVGKAVSADPIRAAFEQNSLRRIRADEKEKMIEALKALDPASIPPEALTAFKQGNWSHGIFSQNEWPLFALHFYIRGDLSIMQLSKLFIFDEARKLDRFQAHDLNNSEDFDLLEQSLEEFEFGDRLFELTKLAASHRQFFSFRVPLDDRADDSFNAARSEGFSDFMKIDSECKEIQGIAVPPLLLYEINRLEQGENATLPDPVLGYDPSDRMEDPKKRIMCIPCRFVSLPTHIHETLQTEMLGMYFHDIFHLTVDSQTLHKEIWVELGKKFKKGPIGEKLGDRNLIYRKKELQAASGKKDTTPQEAFWFNLLSLSKDSEVLISLLLQVFSKEQKWTGKYGLSLLSLETFCNENNLTEFLKEFKKRYQPRSKSPVIGLI